MKQINRQAHLAPAKALFVNMFVTKTAEHEDMRYRPGCLQQMAVTCRQGMPSATTKKKKKNRNLRQNSSNVTITWKNRTFGASIEENFFKNGTYW